MVTYRHILLFLSVLVCCSGIIVKNGRYEDIYIVIQDSVPEDLKLVDRIQEVFTEASHLLFQATNNRVYFGDIKIVVPSTWSPHLKYTSSPTITSLPQYVTIETSDVKAPHVTGIDECGKGGKVMSLSPEFLNSTGFTNYGFHANVIVHEWGHLRWGLFDEYPTLYENNGDGPLRKFYVNDGDRKPITCTASIKASIGLGPYCKPDPKCNTKSIKFSKDCNFCPDIEQAASASLMGHAYIKKLKHFCDKFNDLSVPVEMRHDRLAQNKHNWRCGRRSAWELMREHTDFLKGVNPPQSESTDTIPKFTLIRETSVYMVLVLDVSGSMEGVKLNRLHQASSRLIQDILQLNSFMAIVTFSTSADTAQPLISITSQAIRDLLVAKLPTNTGGSTCIGCGIELGINELRKKLTDPRKSDIIVISDGANNRGNLDTSVQRAIAAGVVVHTISVTQAAQQTLDDIAAGTGGKSFYWTDVSLIGLASAFSQIVKGRVSSRSESSISLFAETKPSSKVTNFTFQIDEGVGRDTKVSVLTGDDTTIEIFVYGPNNFTQDRKASTVNRLTLNIPDNAKPGQYEVKVTLATLTRLEYYVDSYPLPLADPIRFTTRLSSRTVDLSQNKLPILYADVTRRGIPVAGANVTTLVEAVSQSCNMQISDNGLDPDDIKDDGKYSAYILRNCLGNGRINIKVSAKSTGSAFLSKKGLNLAPEFTSDIDTSDHVGLFQRTSLPGELTIENYAEETHDVTPPGQISDLDTINVTSRSDAVEEKRNYTIIWTATGDDMSYGQASSYEFRISDDIQQLLDNFIKASHLQFFNGSVVPKAAGEPESFTVSVSAKEAFTRTTFLAIVAIDEEGNRGEVSNIIPITVATGFNITADVNVYTEEDNEFENEDSSDMDIRIIILIAVAVVVAVGFSITLLIVCRCRSRRGDSGRDTSAANPAASFDDPIEISVVQK